MSWMWFVVGFLMGWLLFDSLSMGIVFGIIYGWLLFEDDDDE